MKVGIDLTTYKPSATGIDVFLQNLVSSLGTIDTREQTYYIFVNYEDRHLFHSLLPANFTIIPISMRIFLARAVGQHLLTPLATSALNLDVLHSPHFLIPFYRGNTRHVVTVYDLTLITKPAFHTAWRSSPVVRRAILRSIHQSHLVTVPSFYVCSDLKRLIPEISHEKLRVIPLGIDNEFVSQPTARIRKCLKRLQVPTPYILYVGTIEPRKNLEVLVEAYSRLIHRGDVPEHLVLVGQLGWKYRSLLERLEDPVLAGRVHRLGYVSQADLPSLYSGASVFVYPSWEEGFGFPPLEAMACGTPVVSSRSSSLVENLDGAAELAGPDDPRAFTDAIVKLLKDEDLRAKRIQQGLERARHFRWEDTARAYAACYRKLAESR